MTGFPFKPYWMLVYGIKSYLTNIRNDILFSTDAKEKQHVGCAYLHIMGLLASAQNREECICTMPFSIYECTERQWYERGQWPQFKLHRDSLAGIDSSGRLQVNGFHISIKILLDALLRVFQHACIWITSYRVCRTANDDVMALRLLSEQGWTASTIITSGHFSVSFSPTQKDTLEVFGHKFPSLVHRLRSWWWSVHWKKVKKEGLNWFCRLFTHILRSLECSYKLPHVRKHPDNSNGI